MIEPRQQGYFKLNDTAIYFRIYGSGAKTLFFLHGNNEDWTCFRKQIEFFASDYKVVTMDSRGHGQSGMGKQEISIRQMAKDTALLIRKLQLEAVTLVGFSDGGNIAMELLIHYPLEVVEGLVLAGANLSPRGIKLYYQVPLILQYALLKCLAGFRIRWKRKAGVIGLMIREPRITPEQLRGVTIPVLVLAGEKDMVRKNHTRKIARAFGNAALVFVPGANHFIFDKGADKTNQYIKNFLES